MADMKPQIEAMLKEARQEYMNHITFAGGFTARDAFVTAVLSGDCDKDDFIVGYMTARRGHG